MTSKKPTNEAMRRTGRVIDQRQQQIDPTGKKRVDQNEAARHSTKQPGQKTTAGDDNAK